MKLREEILKEHSKAQCVRIVKWIGKDPAKFESLMQLFLHDEYRVVQRAGWPLSYSVRAHPELIEKYFAEILENVKQPNIHNAVKRNTMRLLQDVKIPEAYHGVVMNICFDFISSPTEAVAVKAFSFRVLENLSKIYPEILPEIRLVIEERWDHETAAFRTRAKKLMQRFQ
jgi:hypothetical protein